jgi:hypothetical protein
VQRVLRRATGVVWVRCELRRGGSAALGVRRASGRLPGELHRTLRRPFCVREVERYEHETRRSIEAHGATAGERVPHAVAAVRRDRLERAHVL